MQKIIFLLSMLAIQTAGHYQSTNAGSGGSWTFRTNHCQANKFIHHYYSFTAFDTTQSPEPKFIIDFFTAESVVDGTFRLVPGKPMASDQVCIGVGWMHDGVLTFYTSTGQNKDRVTVKMVNGKPHISGTGIELANQKNATDKSPLTFDITIL